MYKSITSNSDVKIMELKIIVTVTVFRGVFLR